MTDITSQLKEQIDAAIVDKHPLNIVGGNSKAFYGRVAVGEALRVSIHRGIINYEPTELVITARAGTPLMDIEQALAEHNQMLPFEPPHFGATATLGGTIACGFSGPRRPYSSAARDCVLGSKIINGKGEVLHFGGEVMKNVAGYDVSRIMVGALGTLGVLLEISLKVLPHAAFETTLVQQCSEAEALRRMNAWAATALPLSATCYVDECLYVRLSGAESAVTVSAKNIGGDRIDDGAGFWHSLREHTLPFFKDVQSLWRIAVPTAAAPLDLSGTRLIEWGGGQRWMVSDDDAQTIRNSAVVAGGHATHYRGGQREGDIFQPLSKELWRLHQNLKQAFDPHGILNPGCLYPGL
jgi:glycolate oxidase FAD binding subunit